MNWNPRQAPRLGRRQTISASAYITFVLLLALSCIWVVNDLWKRSDDVAAVEARLGRVAKETRSTPLTSVASDAGETGSRFLEGPTITIAGATLQERVAAIVTKAGGIVTSSQVEVDGPEATNGFVNLTDSFEASQPALQTILYDIEAGTPYLFVGKLLIQSPEDRGEPESGLMRASMTVSGQWRTDQ